METVFIKLLSMSATASAVILAVLLARILLRNTPKKYAYALWSVTAFRLVCPVSFKGFFSIFQLSPLQPTGVLSIGGMSAIEHLPVTSSMPVQPVTPMPAASAALPLSDAAAVSPSTGTNWLMVGTIIWLIGMAALLLYAIVSYACLRRKIASAIRLEDNIYQADGISSPFTLGIFHPKIYIPYGMQPEALRHVLAHERCHIHRGDHIIRPLSFCILAVHWFNPLCWLAFHLSGKDMEMSCDEKVLAQSGSPRKAYSNTLLSFAERRQAPTPWSLPFGEVSVKSRIKNALKWKKPQTWVTVLAVVLSTVVIAACSANPAATGSYENMEDYAEKVLSDARGSTVTYYTTSGGEATAEVLDAKVYELKKDGELAGLDPNGSLEAWRFNYLVKPDGNAEDITLVGGMFEEDGWFDLEGQGGHTVVALRYPDGTLDILDSFIINDGYPFYGLHESIEQSLYDWYVQEKDADLPLCITDLPKPGERDHSYTMRRFDGDGWYLYLPVSGWEKENNTDFDSWYSHYGSGSMITVQVFDQSAQSQAAALLKNGWEKHSNKPLHLCKRSNDTDKELHSYWFDKPDGGAYRVQTTCVPAHITTQPDIAAEPELLQLMAESFTVDERFTRKPAPSSELWGVRQGDPLKLTLMQDGASYHWSDCWDTDNALHFFGCLASYPWEEADPKGSYKLEGTCVTLQTDRWTLTAYKDENIVKREMDGKVTLFRSASEEDYFANLYDWVLRSWVDELEFRDISREEDYVIPDKGQSYTEAAAEWVQRYEERHLQTRPDSQSRYTFVKTSVEDAAETTAQLRKNNEISDNSWCFYLTTVFVPENDRAKNWSIAGNTAAYDGDDPAVPKSAFHYFRCCIITKESDGWHGSIRGTGW